MSDFNIHSDELGDVHKNCEQCGTTKPETSTLREQMIDLLFGEEGLQRTGESGLMDLIRKAQESKLQKLADLIDQEKVNARLVELDLLEQAQNAGIDLQEFKAHRLMELTGTGWNEKESK